MAKIVLALITMFLSATLGHAIFWNCIPRIKLKQSISKNGIAQWIGYLERALVALFVCLDLTAETVFIFATKAAVIGYRIPAGLSDDDKRSTAENMLVGTMASYLIALIFGLLGQWVITTLTGR